MYYVGIDVGGTGLKAGVVDEQGKILSKVTCPTLVERGAVNTLVIGGRRVGRHRWKINSTSEAWNTILNGGELLRASVSVTMEEYL